jgi:hypothetical protein
MPFYSLNMPPKRKKVQINETPSPSKRVKVRHMHTPANPSDSEEQSSDSSIPGVALCKVTDLVVSVRQTASRQFVISISNSRPDTCLGKKQGDHVSAFTSFIEMLCAASFDQSSKKVAKYFADIGKAIIPDKSENFDQILSQFQTRSDSLYSRKERKRLTRMLREDELDDQEKIKKLKSSLKYAEGAMNKEIIEQMAEEFLRQINLEKISAFKKSGSSDPSEGARVKKAIHALKMINELDRICDVSFNHDSSLEFFYHDYLKIGSKYKDGANAAAGDSVKVTKILRQWDNTVADRKELLRDFRKLISPEKIAGFFGDLFDFEYSKHKEVRLNSLCEIIARHLVIMFHAFHELQKYDEIPKNKIIDSFLQEEILGKQGWSRTQETLDINILKQEISKYCVLEKDNYKMRSSQERRLVSQLPTSQASSFSIV